MNIMETKINQIIAALTRLEAKAKGHYHIFFEYGNGMLRVRIIKGNENTVYEATVNIDSEQEKLQELSTLVKTLTDCIKTTVFQCYKMDFVEGEICGKWEKTGSTIVFGKNATSAMLIDGSGYYIDDPDNKLRYFVDMKTEAEK